MRHQPHARRGAAGGHSRGARARIAAARIRRAVLRLIYR
eukprot:SAG25_NODE_126_length_14581_cov_5.819569_10_plen_39_part_00